MMKNIVDFYDTAVYDGKLPFSKKYDGNFELESDSYPGYWNEYVGMAMVEGKNLLFTRVLVEKDMFESKEGSIQIYELAYNKSALDGDITVFYNTNNRELNNSKLSLMINKKREFLNKGLTIEDVLTFLDVPFEPSPIKDVIESQFKITTGVDYFDLSSNVVFIQENQLCIYGVYGNLFKKCSSFKDETYSKPKTRAKGKNSLLKYHYSHIPDFIPLF